MNDRSLATLLRMAVESQSLSDSASPVTGPILPFPSIRVARAWQRWLPLASAAAAACLLLALPSSPLHSRHADYAARVANRKNFVVAHRATPVIRRVEAAAHHSCRPCDANCDGVVNGQDIDAFVLALTNPTLYGLDFPSCDRYCGSDVNCDSVVDDYDIDPFMVCVTQG